MSGLFDDFIARVKEEGLNDVYGAAVRQHNKLLGVVDLGEPKGRIQLYSASKTWTAMAVGIAESEGLLTLSDRLIDHLNPAELPEDTAEGFEKLRLRDLLTMTVGHAVCPSNRVRDELTKAGKMPQDYSFVDLWFDAFCREPIVHDPEEHWFVYNNGATYMLSCVISRVTGMSVRDYLMPRVFAPLGIEGPYWDADKKGRSFGAFGLFLTTEELARGGQLILDHGVWEGKQLVPEVFAREMVKKQVNNDNVPGKDLESSSGYGYQLWRCSYPETYRMDGMGGVYSIQFPQYDAVVAVTCHEMKRAHDVLRIIWDTIAPKLG